VEVWQENPAQRGEEPVARETTERWGAFIRDLPAGSYIIAAGHPRFVEGRFSLAGYDPEEKAKQQDTPAERQVPLRERPLQTPIAANHFVLDTPDQSVVGDLGTRWRLEPLTDLIDLRGEPIEAMVLMGEGADEPKAE